MVQNLDNLEEIVDTIVMPEVGNFAVLRADYLSICAGVITHVNEHNFQIGEGRGKLVVYYRHGSDRYDIIDKQLMADFRELFYEELERRINAGEVLDPICTDQALLLRNRYKPAPERMTLSPSAEVLAVFAQLQAVLNFPERLFASWMLFRM